MIQLADIISRVESLPPLPQTVANLITVINDPKSNAARVVDAVKYDQAVTTEVLRQCNSAYYGLQRKVTSIDDAMVLLGNAKVLQLVLSVHTNSLLSGPQKGYGLEAGKLWEHSVAVAIAASELAKRTKFGNLGIVFTAGLLHDIGKVVLSQYVADEFAEIIRLVNEEGRSFIEAEHQVLGFSHDEIGAKMADIWALPQRIVDTIRYHHDPWQMQDPDPLVDIVYAANSLCLMLGIGLGEDGLSYRADDRVLERLGLTHRELELVGVETVMRLGEIVATRTESSSCAAPSKKGATNVS